MGVAATFSVTDAEANGPRSDFKELRRRLLRKA